MSGQAKQAVDSLDDIRQALSTGDAQKRRAATAMNDRSSRAHSLFVISMSMSNKATGKCTCCTTIAPTAVGTFADGIVGCFFIFLTGVSMSSELYLADLGGSEQVKKSQVHHGGYDEETGTAKGFVMGANMKEAVNINLGLLALKKCIGALNDGADYVSQQ